MRAKPQNTSVWNFSFTGKSKDCLRIYGPLALTLFLMLFFYSMLVHSLHAALLCLSISIFYSFTAWESSRAIVLSVQRKIPGIGNTKKRLQQIILYSLPVILIVALISYLFSVAIGYYKELIIWDYVFTAGIVLLFSIIIICLYEGLYYIENWKKLFEESEEIKKINLSSQYQFLKDQIKPHFLFNSLNTLTALIASNPQRAERFTEEMATVYRYLLKKNDNHLTTLKEELDFLEAYISMLKTRFEDALKVVIDISREYEDHLLPPLVLQLLVENAVKHNVISRGQPLIINIFTDDNERVHVYNNLQIKDSAYTSEKTGLANMAERYKLLKKDKDLYIAEEDGMFKVIVPLLSASHANSSS